MNDAIYKLRLKQDIKIGNLVDKLFGDENYEELFRYMFVEYPGLAIADESMDVNDTVERVAALKEFYQLLIRFKNDGDIAKESLRSLNKTYEEDEL